MKIKGTREIIVKEFTSESLYKAMCSACPVDAIETSPEEFQPLLDLIQAEQVFPPGSSNHDEHGDEYRTTYGVLKIT